jgi:hypothetical protein
MPDLIGNIAVPEIAPGGSFPLIGDYGSSFQIPARIVEHVFGSANAKITQRFYLGDGAKRWRVVRQDLTQTERGLLRTHWESNSGGYGAFTYNAPNPDGSTTAYTVRYENEPLSFEMLEGAVSSVGVTLVEIPTTGPTYSLTGTQTRFPSSGLQAALLDQVQTIFPVIKIQPTTSGYPAIYVSDRRATIGSQLYQARLIDWGGISQSLGNESDDGQFKFGNADRVMTALANDVDLFRARIEFSLFHVGTGIKIDLWAGDILHWSADEGPEFPVSASDGLYELNLPYPPRRISRTCWKDLDDGLSCPASSSGGTNLGTPCDKGYATPAGCTFHNMMPFFGGIVATPQAVFTKDNSTGVFGFGRSPLTSVSLIADSIYDEVIPEIYTDVPMPVNCKIVEGRDEGDFYIALGIVGEGPIEYGSLTRPGPPPTTIEHSLDGQYWHEYPKTLIGLRRGRGHDPAQNNDPDTDSDKFSLGQGGHGIQTYGPEKSAGTAFIEIRRTDAKGLQLSRLSEHQMQAIVAQGLSGWVWTAPGTRSTAVLTNPIWIVVNALLRARGLRFASAATCEQYFDVDAAIVAAGICDLSVTKLVGSGSETQFKFIGNLQEAKPLRDWVQEILMNCLGYYTFSFGKLRLGIRENSSAVEAFTVGNMIFGSLQLQDASPEFNHLTANFADAEFEFVNNAVQVYDIDHAKKIGGLASPLFLKATINLSGTSSKSPAARVISTRLREELGGTTPTEQKKARRAAFRTTVLALNTEAGQVDSITHPDMPGGTGEIRATAWRLNKDYSIEIQGRTTTDSMYDLTFGPKPADVVASAVPNEEEFAPADWGFEITAEGDGIIRARNLTCATNPLTVYQATFTVYFVDETEDPISYLTGNITSGATVIFIQNTPPAVGEWILIDGEIMEVTAYDFSTGTVVVRGALGSTAVAHNPASTTVSAIGATKAVLTVGTGLTMKPGNDVVQLTGGADVKRIASYNSATGDLVTRSPMQFIHVGNTLVSAQRVYHVQKRDFRLTLQPRFFKSGDRAAFVFEMPVPVAGVVAVSGILENTRGLQSEVTTRNFTGAGYPYRLRTLGNDKVNLIHPDVPSGSSADLFESVAMPSATSFGLTYAERTKPDNTGPITPPATVPTITRISFSTTGSITIAGTINANGRISVTIGNGTTDRVHVAVPTFPVTTETTAAGVATSLANWLNGTEDFFQYFSATPVGAVVNLTDKTGVGGHVSASTSGGVTATAAGMTAPLGIVSGRRYVVSFLDSTDGYESEISMVSDASSPSGGAASLQLEDVPVSSDSRVTNVRVWAYPDGADSGTPRLVASVANGTTSVADSIAEASLSSQTAYPGPSQPSATGAVTVTVNRGGSPWLEFRIPTGQARSNIIDGIAAGPVAAGTEITADIDNSAGAHQLKVMLQ